MTSTTIAPITFSAPAQAGPTWWLDEPAISVAPAQPVSAATAAARTEARGDRRVGLRRLRTVLSPVRWVLVAGWLVALLAGHVLHAVGLGLLAGVAALTNQPRTAGAPAGGVR